MEDLRIAGVEPATCNDHATVTLEDAEGVAIHRIRVDVASGHAVLSELSGVPGQSAVFVDIIRAITGAHGSEIGHIEISTDGDSPTGTLYFNGEKGRGGISRLPAGVVLVLAARLGLPVRLSSCARRQAAVPRMAPAVREFLTSLDIEGRLGS